MVTVPIHAGIYARISKDPDQDEAGVTRQLEDCRTLVRQKGWALAGEYVDNDIVASTGKHRPQYRRLVDDAVAGRITVIVLYSTSRLWRNRIERAHGFKTLGDAGVSIEAVKGQSFNLSDSAGRVLAGVLGEIDTHEIEQMGERMSRAALQKAQRGEYFGQKPFGYQKVYAVDGKGNRRFTGQLKIVPEEADAIREAADMTLAGESLRAVIRQWESKGIKPQRVDRWTSPVVRQILTNPLYVGLRVYEGKGGPTETNKGQWTPILDVDTHDLVCAVLADPSRSTRGPRGTVPRYLLTGIVRCGVCDGWAGAVKMKERQRLTGKRAGATVPAYVGYACREQRHASRDVAAVDEWVRTCVFHWLDSNVYDAAIQAELSAEVDTHALLREQNKDKARRQKVEDKYADEDYTKAEYLRQCKRLDKQINDRQKLLDSFIGRRRRDSAVPAERGDALAAMWKAAGLEKQRSIVAALVDRVIIHPLDPAKRGGWTFDPTKVIVVPGGWAEGVAPEATTVPMPTIGPYWRSEARDVVITWMKQNPDCDISAADIDDLGLSWNRKTSYRRNRGRWSTIDANGILLAKMARQGLLVVSVPGAHTKGPGTRGQGLARYRLADGVAEYYRLRAKAAS